MKCLGKKIRVSKKENVAVGGHMKLLGKRDPT